MRSGYAIKMQGDGTNPEPMGLPASRFIFPTIAPYFLEPNKGGSYFQDLPFILKVHGGISKLHRRRSQTAAVPEDDLITAKALSAIDDHSADQRHCKFTLVCQPPAFPAQRSVVVSWPGADCPKIIFNLSGGQ